MHSDTQFFDSKNLSRPLVIIPFGLIFIVNLIITQVNGFGYAGELAIFSAASSFLAILFSMQWDIEILIRDKDKMLVSIYSGILVATFFFTVSIGLYFLLNFLSFNFYLFLTSSATLLAINEILLSGLVKLKKYKIWILVRSLTPIMLFFFAINQFSIELTWLFAQLVPLIALVLFYFGSFKSNLINGFSISLKNLFSRSCKLLSLTASYLISNSILLFCLIGISFSLDNYEAGLWVNAYRIFSAPVVLSSSIILPFVLSKIGDIAYISKFKIFYKYLLGMTLLLIFISPFVYFFGSTTFKTLTNSSSIIEGYLCIPLCWIGAMPCLIQNMRSFFHSIDKAETFLVILILFIFLIGAIFFSVSSISLVQISERIFYSTFFIFILIILNLLNANYIKIEKN